ncbi:hypothetical protein HMPREF1869_01364 [Bacteroidales bacterium KA00251]|nr:hypothetical protein HMPREF1869_01364 [Bacteroidales bacterium KA00251]
MKLEKMLYVVLMLVCMLSCTSKSPKQKLDMQMDYPVSMNLSIGKNGLRAEHKSTSLSASFPNERAIENLVVVVFTNATSNNTPGSLEKVITQEAITLPSGGDPYNGAIKFDMGMAGTFHMEVIANGYKGDTDKAHFLSLLQKGISYDQFKQIVIDRPLPQHGEEGFVMLGAETVKVTTRKTQTADAGVVKLRRLACRFDVFNKLVSDLKLTKITLTKQVKKSYLLRQLKRPSDYATMGNEVVYTPDGDWFTNTMATGGIYSYESYGSLSYLIFEGTYKGLPWRKEIHLEKKGKELTLERNHIYRIYLTNGNGTTPGGGDGGGKDPSNADKVHYLIRVVDWSDDQDLDYNDDDVMKKECPPVNPLKYVAEYNINKTGDGFVTDKYATNVSGYFQTVMAMRLFANTTIGGKPYHLPSREEWQSILPSMKVVDKASPKDITQAPLLGISFKEPFSKTSSEEVEVAGERVVCHQEMKGLGDNKCYALRYKGTIYQSAWKYEFVKSNNHQVLKITSRNIKGDEELEEIAQDAYWQQNREKDVVRIFPASGYYDANKVHYDWMAGRIPYPDPRLAHGFEIKDHSADYVGAFSSCTFPNSSSLFDRDHLPYIAMFGERNACTSIIPFSPYAAQSVRLFEGPGKPIPMEYCFPYLIDRDRQPSIYHLRLSKYDENGPTALCAWFHYRLPALYFRFPNLKKGGDPYVVPLSPSSYTFSYIVHGNVKNIKINDEKESNVYNPAYENFEMRYLTHAIPWISVHERVGQYSSVVKVGDFVIFRATPKYESGHVCDFKLQVRGLNPLGIRRVKPVKRKKVDSDYLIFDMARSSARRITWLSLIPSIKIDFKHPMNPSQEYVDYVSLRGSLGGTTSEEDTSRGMECRQQFKGSGNGVVYGLRYKGTYLQSAWKYEWVSTSNQKGLQITSRIVDDGVSLAEIASAQFWQQNSDQDEKVFFPAMGYIPEGSTQPQEVGRKVMLWSPYRSIDNKDHTERAHYVSASEDGISYSTEKAKVGVRMQGIRFVPYSRNDLYNKFFIYLGSK